MEFSAAVDSEGIGQYLKDDEFSVPVVTVETGIESEMPKTEAHISADNYAMGQMLGEKILKDMEQEGKKETVAVIREYMERDSVGRKDMRDLCLRFMQAAWKLSHVPVRKETSI